MAIMGSQVSWQEAQLRDIHATAYPAGWDPTFPTSPHGTLIEFPALNTSGEQYKPINQGDIDDELERDSSRKQSSPTSNAPFKKIPSQGPLWRSLESAGFAFSVVLCIALAVVLSKINSPGIQGGGYNLDGLSTLDCSRIQTIGVRSTLLLERFKYTLKF